MRRPSPLPSPAPRPAAPPAAAPAAEVPAPVAVTPPEPEAAEERTAPVIPFGAPSTHAVPGAEDETKADDAALGLRDVWRAARARRRALRAEVRRFTTRQRRRRMLWLGVAGAVVLLVAGTVGAAYSPLFAVRQLEIAGTTQLDAAALEDALAGQLGSPLALVDSSAVKAALVQFPLVESYTLEARPPDTLVVRIVERTPVGYVDSPAGYTVVDAAGVSLSTTPETPPGVPALEISGGLRSDAFEAAGQVMRSLPDGIRPLVTGVSASTADDVTLTLGATDTQLVWGSADDSAKKAVTLERVLLNRALDATRLIDVSSPDAVVVA